MGKLWESTLAALRAMEAALGIGPRKTEPQTERPRPERAPRDGRRGQDDKRTGAGRG